MTTLVYIPGTHDWEPPDDSEEQYRWWQSRSRWCQGLLEDGFTRFTGWDLRHRTDPSIVIEASPWGCGLAGTAWAGLAKRTWWSGAHTVTRALIRGRTVDPDMAWVLACHSHAGQIGVLVDWLLRRMGYPGLDALVTICTPVRKDMHPYYRLVRCPWLNIYNPNYATNFMQWMGQRGRVRLSMPGTTVANAPVSGIGHSAFVRDPDAHASAKRDLLLPFLWNEVTP